MPALADEVHDEVVVPALAELREARRRRRIGQWHLIDALYKAYLTGLGGAIALTGLSGVVGDDRVGRAVLDDIRAVGPGAVGAVLALVLALGLRSGARGGPLALEAAEVRHVLLAPVDRDVALRAPALRQLRFSAFTGLVMGAAVGLLAYRRLPGTPALWVLAGAVVGVCAGVAGCGLALVASGRRAGRVLAGAAGAVLAGWSVADILLRAATSPLSWVGRVALWPLVEAPSVLPGLGLAVVGAGVAAGAGLAAVGGLSVEAAERRGRLVSHLRFAATFQDLRTVMLLRRQLSNEVPRARPWVHLRPASGGRVTWRRDWRGILRWPATRLARLAALGAVGGAAMAGAWADTTPLVLVTGCCLFVAALEATEGLAQEIDHPDRLAAVPAPAGAVHLRHLLAPTVVLTAVGLVGLGAAAVVSGAYRLVLEAGLPLVVPAAALAAGAAAASELKGPPEPGLLGADATGLGLVLRQAFPPLLATVAPALALFLVREEIRRRPDVSIAVLAGNAAFTVTLVLVMVLGWVRHREGLARLYAGEGLAGVGR